MWFIDVVPPSLKTFFMFSVSHNFKVAAIRRKKICSKISSTNFDQIWKELSWIWNLQLFKNHIKSMVFHLPKNAVLGTIR